MFQFLGRNIIKQCFNNCILEGYGYDEGIVKLVVGLL